MQILPVYALTGNIILSYNLLFLSTFVLSGLGMFLFVREITGSARAGFVAGLIYAFAPYRVPQFSHLQVISSQWMPFALYGLRRYFDDAARMAHRSPAAARAVAQNLSNGYFLLFFAPFVAGVRALRDRHAQALDATRACGSRCRQPPRRVTARRCRFCCPTSSCGDLGFGRAALNEVKSFSADVFSYWTCAARVARLWGSLIRAFPKPEGDLFPTLAALAAGRPSALRRERHGGVDAGAQRDRRRPRTMAWIAARLRARRGLRGLRCCSLVLILTGHGFTRIGPLPISVRNRLAALPRAGHRCSALLLLVSPRARSFARAWSRERRARSRCSPRRSRFLLSLGPEIRTDGRLIGEVGPYSPSLLGTSPASTACACRRASRCSSCCSSRSAAGLGAAALETAASPRRHARARTWRVRGRRGVRRADRRQRHRRRKAATRHRRRASTPAIRCRRCIAFSKRCRRPGTVVVEFPFGEWAYELRYVFYSTAHWHPLLNGYSGHFPAELQHERDHAAPSPRRSGRSRGTTLMRSAPRTPSCTGRYYRDDEGSTASRGGCVAQAAPEMVAEFDGDRVFRVAKS